MVIWNMSRIRDETPTWLFRRRSATRHPIASISRFLAILPPLLSLCLYHDLAGMPLEIMLISRRGGIDVCSASAASISIRYLSTFAVYIDPNAI